MMPRWAKIMLIILALYLIYKVPNTAGDMVTKVVDIATGFANSVGTFFQRVFR